MMPAHVTDSPPLVYVDSVDVPVLLRDAPADRPWKQWRTASHAPWASDGAFPAENGWYLPTTTWRDIVKAATEVGRDVTPWLRQADQLARGELVARVAPLYAYLGIHGFPGQHDHNSGRRLTVNAVYEYGTEKTAKAALGYRLGMTMAEWACRSLMGLGQTWHIEDGGPERMPEFEEPHRSLPDLWGVHDTEKAYWLIEAKGGNVRKGDLVPGWQQLSAAGELLNGFEHRLILCGASVRPQGDLFLTIDHQRNPGLPPTGLTPGRQNGPSGAPSTPEDHLGEDDDALLGTARSQMLSYLVLRSAARSQLRRVPLPSDRTSRRRRSSGLVIPLETDEDTLQLRDLIRDHPEVSDPWTSEVEGVEDFLSCRVPGTEVHVGMSRRLFTACDQLYKQDLIIAEETRGLRAEDSWFADELRSDATWRRRIRAQRSEYRERQGEARPRVRARVRQAFEEGDRSNWHDLLGGELPARELGEDTALLEGTTAETYIAVRRGDLPEFGLRR